MRKMNVSDVSLEESKIKSKEDKNLGVLEGDKKDLRSLSRIERFRSRLKNLTGFQKYMIFSLSSTAIILVLAVVLYLIATKPVYTPPYLVAQDLQYIEVVSVNSHQKITDFNLDTPNKPRTEVSPINGLLFTKEEMSILSERAPVAVMINNHSDARPQSSLNSADIVFETEVESGITRYMAIYWSKEVEKVGPIRSVRNYYLEWLTPYDAILIHDGCALSEDPEVNACGNLYNYGIRDVATHGAWREFDGVRVAPHNEYSSVNEAWSYSETLGWNVFPANFKPWEFKRDEPTTAAKSGASIIFNSYIYNGGAYDVKWQYDNESNSYLRSFKNSPDIDQETNQQVTAKTVIVQLTTITQTFDDKGHIIVKTIGNGDAKILMDGKVINGSWRKNSRNDRTVYYDENGDEMKFNRGRIWITAIDPNQGQFDIIGQ